MALDPSGIPAALLRYAGHPEPPVAKQTQAAPHALESSETFGTTLTQAPKTISEAPSFSCQRLVMPNHSADLTVVMNFSQVARHKHGKRDQQLIEPQRLMS